MQKDGLLRVATLVLLVAHGGCAVFMDADYRRTVGRLDAHVQPKSTAARIALAPIAVPVATGAVVVDAVLVNPVVAVPSAAKDVYRLYWAPRDMDPLLDAMLFMPKTILTPPTYALDWLGRAAVRPSGAWNE